MGTAATSAALPHDAARLHFGTVPPGRVDTRRVGARSTRAALGAGRPNGPGAGTAATSAALPQQARQHRPGARRSFAALGAGRQSGGAFRVLRRAAPQRPATCCIVAPHRRARIPAPRQETPRHRKMRFHRVIILEAVAPRGVIRSAAMNCGLPRSVSVAWARREADTFPVLAHACQDLSPVRSAGGERHGPPPRTSGYG